MVSIAIQTKGSIPVVVPAGRIDTSTGAEFGQALQPLTENEKYLVIDLSQCSYLSSAGIRILLMTEKKLLAAGGGLFLSGLKPEIFQILEIAGLHRILHLFETTEAAISEIERIRLKTRGSCEWSDGTFSFQFHQMETGRQAARWWKDAGICGYNELDMAIGTGAPCEAPEGEEPSWGVFFSNGKCTGFIPYDESLMPDFRIPQNPASSGVMIREAFSFSQQPAGLVRLSEPASIPYAKLAEGLYRMKGHVTPGHQDLLGLVIADFDPETPSVSICLLVDRALRNAIREAGLDEMEGLVPGVDQGILLWGARFVLDEVPKVPGDISLSNFLANTLNFEHIIDLRMVRSGDQAVNPISWMFVSKGYEAASSGRLQIDTEDGFPLDSRMSFLTRRLYTDSARLLIKKLHGGYSAQTYQVTSFDHRGRKLRPTVLKIADRAMITRESERCQQYALPYILNNSAMVLGTEFFGNTGALRYNFVGIGGEQAQLKWLTHYYKSWPPDQLEPLFDKIFLQILNPWYGQPIREMIYPFFDHDPRSTFFPGLCETAEELFSVSADQPFIKLEETGQSLVNPYWFLKHEFSRLRSAGIDYYTSVCHGDLNMQNILLDDDMNVYLIDFSETKPRSLVSDFARLEAIFMIDNAPLDSENDVEEYIKFIAGFYRKIQFDEFPVNDYQGLHTEELRRNISLSLKMRKFASDCVNGDPNPVPYCLALLEWILPVVCYSSASMAHKRLSMIVSGLLCEAVMGGLQGL